PWDRMPILSGHPTGLASCPTDKEGTDGIQDQDPLPEQTGVFEGPPLMKNASNAASFGEKIRSTLMPPVRAWERFWFTPADPTPLGLMRICAGIIILYTVVVQSFDLYELYGPDGWIDLRARQETIHDQPTLAPFLNWDEFTPAAKPVGPQQEHFAE